MTFSIQVSGTFARQFRRLPADAQKRIRKALVALGNDPLAPRSGVDIKRLAGTDPPKLRLRLGEYRIVYAVPGRTVRVIELFARSRGYRFD